MALCEKDYKLIGKLIDISTSIYNCYIKLRRLEEAGSINSIEYETTVENMKNLISEEDKYYAELHITCEKITEISKYFFCDNIELDFLRILNIAESRNAHKLVHLRILLRLQDAVNNRLLKRYSKELLRYIFFPEYKNNINGLKHLPNIASDKDYFNTVFTILNNNLKENIYENVYTDLLILKYNLSYLWPYIEQNNITYNFGDIPLYWGATMYSDILHISEKNNVLSTNIDICHFFLDLLLNNLFGIAENTLKEKEITFALIYLRAGLMFATTEVLEEFKRKFELTVVNNSMKKGNLSIEADILDILDSCLKDKEIPILVRFNNKGLCAKK